MYEFVPLIGGVVIGLVGAQLSGKGVRAVVLIVLSLLLGYVASALSGELAASWVYLLFDAGQALVASVATLFLLDRWQQRAVH